MCFKDVLQFFQAGSLWGFLVNLAAPLLSCEGFIWCQLCLEFGVICMNHATAATCCPGHQSFVHKHSPWQILFNPPPRPPPCKDRCTKVGSVAHEEEWLEVRYSAASVGITGLMSGKTLRSILLQRVAWPASPFPPLIRTLPPRPARVPPWCQPMSGLFPPLWENQPRLERLCGLCHPESQRSSSLQLGTGSFCLCVFILWNCSWLYFTTPIINMSLLFHKSNQKLEECTPRDPALPQSSLLHTTLQNFLQDINLWS